MRYARSAEFLQQPLLQNLRWLRVVGDTIFALGAVGIGRFVLGLKAVGPSPTIENRWC